MTTERDGCCAAWPKPCSYHEGWLDALDAPAAGDRSLPSGDDRTGLIRVYVAHPVTSYGTAHEAACLDAIAGLLPVCELLNPSDMFAGSAEWLSAWPRLLDQLDALVVFPAEDGTIGTGCLRELADTVTWSLPAYGFALGRGLVEIAGVDFLPEYERYAARVGTLRFGKPYKQREEIGR